MIIVLTRHKRADHKIVPFKCLMHWWRLMQSPGYRLEIVDRETVRIMKAVPANKIERMRAIDVRINEALLFDQDLKITVFIMSFDILGQFEVALAIGRMLHQLAILVEVPLG